MPRKLGFLFLFGLLLYSTAISVAIFEVPPAHGWQDTIKMLGVAVALATGIFAPISSIFLALLQARIASESARELETLRAAIATTLEVNKALIAGRVRAFDTMLTAAHFLYFAIRKQVFRRSDGDSEIEREADRRAAEASSVVWYLSENDRRLWFDVYQGAIHLLDEIRDQPDDKRRELFDRLASQLGSAMQLLEEAGLRVIAEADHDRASRRASPDSAVLRYRP